MPGQNRIEVLETCRFLKSKLISEPCVAILTGTGLGDMANGMSTEFVCEYSQIPHFPDSTVQSHHGRLIAGTMGGQNVIILQGRFHLYEGYDAKQVTFPIRVLKELGVRVLILTNAAGGLNPSFSTGDLMVITDHINLTGENPLVGPNEELWGPRFPDMISAYDNNLTAKVRQEAQKEDIDIKTGVYIGLKGPSMETPAEMRMLRTLGADAVGLSTVMESIAAVHCGMQVLGLSIITNMNLPQALEPALVENVIAVAQEAAPKMKRLISALIDSI
ncbi:MAG: purine-nucleoside phosphorylase [Desulfobacteraceae bacterium]|nr:purine-nucleoside phosphorylase [Desulfobacteraceae bacterium]